MSKDIIAEIKAHYNHFYDELLSPNNPYENDIKLVRYNIQSDHVFTHSYGYKQREKCIYEKSNKINHTQLFKKFIEAFLSSKDHRDFFKFLIDTNYSLTLFRSAYDNKQIRFLPSKFKNGYQDYKLPFSTTLNPEFAKHWIADNSCCIYVIKVDFGRFREFINYDDDLEYIPMIYLDETQQEITLGPGRLSYRGEYTIFNEKSGTSTRCLQVDYIPFPIDYYWKNHLYKDCSEL